MTVDVLVTDNCVLRTLERLSSAALVILSATEYICHVFRKSGTVCRLSFKATWSVIRTVQTCI